ncbi:hypothetical protein BCR36DRAFT_410248, partial [Piromyces finnis]
MSPKNYVTYQIKFEPHLEVNSQNIPKETRKNILSIKLSEKNEDWMSVLHYSLQVADLFYNTDDYQRSAYFYEKAIKASKILNNYTQLSYSYSKCASALHSSQSEDKVKDLYTALDYHKLSLDIQIKYKIRKDKANLLDIPREYFAIGLVYLELGEFESDKSYYQHSIENFLNCKAALEKLKDTGKATKKLYAETLLNLGIIWNIHLEDHKKAGKAFEASHKISVEIGDKENLRLICENFGFYYFNNKDYKNALKCYKDNLKMCQEMKLHLEKAQCYCDIGLCYKSLHMYNEALSNFNEYYMHVKDLNLSDHIEKSKILIEETNQAIEENKLKNDLENQLKVVIQNKDFINEFKILKKLNKSLIFLRYRSSVAKNYKRMLYLCENTPELKSELSELLLLCGTFYNENKIYDKGYKFLRYLEKKFNGPLAMKAEFYKQLAISLENLKKSHDEIERALENEITIRKSTQDNEGMYNALINLIRIHKLYNLPAKAQEAQEQLNMIALPNTESSFNDPSFYSSEREDEISLIKDQEPSTDIIINDRITDNALSDLYNTSKRKKEKIKIEKETKEDEENIDNFYQNKYHKRKKKRSYIYSSSEEESDYRDHNPNFKEFNKELEKLKKRKIRQEKYYQKTPKESENLISDTESIDSNDSIADLPKPLDFVNLDNTIDTKKFNSPTEFHGYIPSLTTKKIRVCVNFGKDKLLIPCPASETIEWLMREAEKRYYEINNEKVYIRYFKVDNDQILYDKDLINDILIENQVVE